MSNQTMVYIQPSISNLFEGLGTLWVSLLSSLIFSLIGGYFYYKNAFSYWSKKGVKGPKPWPIAGNFIQMIRKSRLKSEIDMVRKYGKLYGIYLGIKPSLVIADPEVIRNICIRDFDAFPNHELNEFSNSHQKNFIIFLQDDHWKRVRAMMSPTFTSGKIRRMFTLMDYCANDLIQNFNEQLARSKSNKRVQVNVKETYGLYTFDVVSTCCYGLKMERSGLTSLKAVASRDDFVKICMAVFKFRLIRIIAAITLPKKLLHIFRYSVTSERDMIPLYLRVQKLIESRRNSNKKFDDYLQILLETKLNDTIDLDEMDSKENHHAGLTQESLLDDQRKMVRDIEEGTKVENRSNWRAKVALSDQEIIANAMFLLVVGLETTATLLTHCSYALAFHQDIQEKLYQEVIKIAEPELNKEDYSFNYEAITSCQYLDAVISETLRALPAVIQMDRKSSRDYVIEKYNISLPKKTQIFLALYALMNDPDYWEEPEKFNPERFMPGNREKIVPGSYCPFGIGPRHCLGMRFSLTEAKLALAKMIIKFRFEPAKGTKYPPESSPGMGLNNIKTPHVDILARD